MKSAHLLISALLLALAFSVVMSACSQPPQEEIMAAEDAVRAAESAGADEYSPKLLDKARRFLSESKILMEQGHYKEAVKKADFAVMRAQQAEKNASRLAGVQRSHDQEEPAAEVEGDAEGETE